MRLKLTPLNILTAVIIFAVGWLLINNDKEGWRALGSVSLVLLAIVCFISDLVFRIFVKDVKRIWIIEVVFVIFAAAVMILFNTI